MARLQTQFEQAQRVAVADMRSKLDAKRSELNRIGATRHHSNPFGRLLTIMMIVVMTGVGLEGLIGTLVVTELRGEFLLLVLAPLFGIVVLLSVEGSISAQGNRSSESDVQELQRLIKSAERKLQDEQSRQFDPISPKPYL